MKEMSVDAPCNRQPAILLERSDRVARRWADNAVNAAAVIPFPAQFGLNVLINTLFVVRVL